MKVTTEELKESVEKYNESQKFGYSFSISDIFKLVELLTNAQKEVEVSPVPQMPLETAIIKYLNGKETNPKQDFLDKLVEGIAEKRKDEK